MSGLTYVPPNIPTPTQVPDGVPILPDEGSQKLDIKKMLPFIGGGILALLVILFLATKSKKQPANQSRVAAQPVRRYSAPLQRPVVPKKSLKNLTSQMFEQMQRDSAAFPFIVAFVTDSCPLCKTIKPVLSEAARATRVPIYTAAPDDAPELYRMFEIRGVPMLKKFTGAGAPPIDFQGARTPEAIVAFAEQ